MEKIYIISEEFISEEVSELKTNFVLSGVARVSRFF